VRDVQLVLHYKEQFVEVRRLNRNGPVTFKGSLFHSITGHHHTKVLMWVTDIKGR